MIKTMCGKLGRQMRRTQDWLIRSELNFQKNTEDIPRKISTKRGVQRSSVAGDLLENRFHHMMKKLEFP